MTSEKLYAGLIAASGAKTEDEKARVAWRLSDWLWKHIAEDGELVVNIVEARAFNNLLQGKGLPWVDLQT